MKTGAMPDKQMSELCVKKLIRKSISHIITTFFFFLVTISFLRWGALQPQLWFVSSVEQNHWKSVSLWEARHLPSHTEQQTKLKLHV